MGEDDTSFGAIVAAGVTMLIGTKLLVGAMIEMLSVTGGTAELLLESVPATTIVGIVLLLATGALVARLWWSRSLAIVALAITAVLGRPAMGDPDPVALAQTALAIVTVLTLLVVNPIRQTERSDIDDSTSASKVGSTIR